MNLLGFLRSNKMQYIIFVVLYTALTLSFHVVFVNVIEIIVFLISLFGGKFKIVDSFYSPQVDIIVMGMFVLSIFAMGKVKNSILFFFITVIITALGHFFLTFTTSAELKDWKLVIGAGAYYSLISYSLVLIRSRLNIKNKSKIRFGILPFVLLVTWFLLVRGQSSIDCALYWGFAWHLNKFDYLFSKLNLDFAYFEIVKANLVIGCIGIVLIKKEKMLQKIWVWIKKEWAKD